ncbi:hypothetical protein IFO70_10195 [Phormidium tenue FACHB-886]|nr:hypothetical protein [Phormidium tenue FACHB-886]
MQQEFKWRENVLAIGVLLTILTTVTYSCGRPWTCAEAESELKAVDREREHAYDALDTGLVNLDYREDNAAYDRALNRWAEAQRTRDNKCAG